MYFMAVPSGVPAHKRNVSEDSVMENPRDAKLSEIRQMQEYRKQLGAMLPHLDKRLKRQLQAELTTLEEQINELWSEIRPRGCNRSGQGS